MCMKDDSIVDLYWARDTKAIEETANKYGRYCYSIAYNVLGNNEDAEECVNDAYLNAWNSIPPQRPYLFSAFLGRITRNVSLNRWNRKNAEKRGGGQVDLALDELQECIPSRSSVEIQVETNELANIIEKFLKGVSNEERDIFICRYWYLESVTDICNRFGYSESRIKVKLFRIRKKLQTRLEKEGVWL